MRTWMLALALMYGCGPLGEDIGDSYTCAMEGENCRGRESADRTAGRETNERGPQGPSGPKGDQGRPGETGEPGTPGTDGYSVVTASGEIPEDDAVCPTGGTRVIFASDSNRNEIWDAADSSQQEISICNGQPGEPGESAPLNPFSIVEVIHPCDGTGISELILRLESGDLLAHYSHGNKQFLTFLVPGNYQLTDGSGCLFSVGSDMSVNW